MKEDNYEFVLSLLGHACLIAGIIMAIVFLSNSHQPSESIKDLLPEPIHDPLWIPAIFSFLSGIASEIVFGAFGRVIKYLKIISENKQ